MSYIVRFSKTYSTKEEYNFRLDQFKRTLASIAVHNARNDATFKLGLNKFSDLTKKEYKSLLGYKKEVHRYG